MANRSPARALTPVIPDERGEIYETVTFADADALVLTGPGYGFRHRFIEVAISGGANADAATINDGNFPGQRITFMTPTATYAFGLPTGLTNVTFAADVDTDDTTPKTIVWTGSTWMLAAA